MPIPTYEVFRRIRNGHTKITDPTATALATMLEVPVDEVYAAARIRPRLGRFELPTRADRLNDAQRKAVLGVVDAILDAGDVQVDHIKPVSDKGMDVPNLIVVHKDDIAHAVRDELTQTLGRKTPEKLVRVAVTNALDAERHPELYEDVAARGTTE